MPDATTIITSAPNQYQIMLDNYSSIVEKTNGQLNLWFNPYTILITALGVLFAVGAIVAAIIIYRQSQDFKSKMEQDRELYAQKINEFLSLQKKVIENNNKKIKEGAKKIDFKIKEYEKKLAESSEKQKKEIKEKINALELEKLKLDITPAEPITVSSNFMDYGTIGYLNNLNKKLVHCSNPKCGFNFYVDMGLGVGALTIGSTATCPKCSNINNIY